MGNMKGMIGLMVAGLVIIVIGLSLSGTILGAAETSGSAGNIGSFSGAKAMNDLIPLLYYVVIVTLGVGLIAAGGYGSYKKFGN